MSNVLKKDRKPAEMKILVDAENLAISVNKAINDDGKFSKRERLSIGERIFNNTMDSYESLRAANNLFPKSKQAIRKRMDLGENAQISINKAISDLRVFAKASNNTSIEMSEWYIDMMNDAVKQEKGITKWHRGDYDRCSKILDEQNKQREKVKESKSPKILIKAVAPEPLIPDIDVNDKDLIKKHIN